jgi:hypothetical protein
MKNNVAFLCRIGTTDTSAALGMEIWIDDQKIFDTMHVAAEIECHANISDDDGDHQLRFVMKNKTIDHTQIDEVGKIVKDACLTISQVTFDEIALGHMFIEQATYTHDFNGTQTEVTGKFYGSMGCNGTVSLGFTTPIYLWLLEHM